jgi:hypothetical protein
MATGDTYEIAPRVLVRRYYYRADSPTILSDVPWWVTGWGDDQVMFQYAVSLFKQDEPPARFLYRRGTNSSAIEAARAEWATRRSIRLTNRRTGQNHVWPLVSLPVRAPISPPFIRRFRWL